MNKYGVQAKSGLWLCYLCLDPEFDGEVSTVWGTAPELNLPDQQKVWSGSEEQAKAVVQLIPVTHSSHLHPLEVKPAPEGS